DGRAHLLIVLPEVRRAEPPPSSDLVRTGWQIGARCAHRSFDGGGDGSHRRWHAGCPSPMTMDDEREASEEPRPAKEPITDRSSSSDTALAGTDPDAQPGIPDEPMGPAEGGD